MSIYLCVFGCEYGVNLKIPCGSVQYSSVSVI